MEKIKHLEKSCEMRFRVKGGGLLTLNALAAPHVCADANCPGDLNRRKLEMFDRYKKALEGLTPGGSEFVDDPERCATFVREARESQARGMQMWAKRAHANETKLELWDEMLAALERSRTLLVAASNFVESNPIKEYTVTYDEAECDGHCLSDDCCITSRDVDDLIAKAKELK